MLVPSARVYPNVRTISLQIPITSDHSLLYSSDRADGRHEYLHIQILGEKVPEKLLLVFAEMQIAGKRTQQKLSTKANLETNFTWDRENIYWQREAGLVWGKSNLYFNQFFILKNMIFQSQLATNLRIAQNCFGNICHSTFLHHLQQPTNFQSHGPSRPSIDFIRNWVCSKKAMVNSNSLLRIQREKQ